MVTVLAASPAYVLDRACDIAVAGVYASLRPMQPGAYGIEGIVDEDRAYQGSRFAEVRDAVFGEPYPGTLDGNGRMPTYSVTLGRMLHGLLKIPFGRWYAFRQATARTVDSHADLRWGPDRKGFRRLVHPNGICPLGV